MCVYKWSSSKRICVCICIFMCVHICLADFCKALSLSLFGYLSASFSVFYLLPAIFIDSEEFLSCSVTLFSLAEASQHLFSFGTEQRSGMILTLGETFSNGAGSNSDAGDVGETGEGASELAESAETSGG